MTLRVITPPAPEDEPVSLAAAKAALRVDGDEHDAEIQALIAAAREHAELYNGRNFARKTFEAYFDGWPAAGFTLADPLVEVTSIVYHPAEGQPVTLPAQTYVVDTKSQPGRVLLASGQAWPTAALAPGLPITLTFSVGFEPADVPPAIAAGIKMLVAHYFDNPSQVSASGAAQGRVPFGIEACFDVDRLVQF